MKANQLLRAAIFAGAIAAPIEILAADKSVARQMTPAAVRLPIEGDLPSLGSATEWLNSQPLTAAGLGGKVVLIDFWTYSRINWLRSLPSVRAWAANKANGRIAYRFHARDLHLVMGPAARGTSVRFRVLIEQRRSRSSLSIRAWRLLRSRSADATVGDRLSHSCQKDRRVEPRARMAPSHERVPLHPSRCASAFDGGLKMSSKTSAPARFAVIGVALAAVIGTFAYVGGWLTPNALTPARSPMVSSTSMESTPASVAIMPRGWAFQVSLKAMGMACVSRRQPSFDRGACR